MYFNARTHVLATLTALFAMSGVRAQRLSSVATSYTPHVTFPSDDAFVFCSAQDCTGTCEVVNTNMVPRDDGEEAPGGMGFKSIYWYDPGNYAWTLYTCLAYECTNAIPIGKNKCYNLYDNGVSTDFYVYYYFVNV